MSDGDKGDDGRHGHARKPVRAELVEIRHRYFHRRYAILFYSLVITLGIGPLVAALDLDVRLLHLFIAFNLVALAMGAGGEGRGELLRFAIGAVIVFRLLAVGINDPFLIAFAVPLWTVIAMIGAARALRFSLRATEIDSEHVYAALSAYLLAGIFFGALYSAIEEGWHGSFTEGGESLHGRFSLANAIYFSFVTLATLGYGDFLPRSEVARGLAMIEAVAGQLYLAVLVARIVSLHVGRKARGEG